MDETAGKTGPAEAEAFRMAAVLDAAYPEGWQFRVYWGRNSMGYIAFAAAERFNGCSWLTAGMPMSSGWVSDKESAFEALLGHWSRRDSWYEESRGIRLPWPPAASAVELCLKLEMLEAGS